MANSSEIINNFTTTTTTTTTTTEAPKSTSTFSPVVSLLVYFPIGLVIIAMTAIILRLMGRNLISKSGKVKFWTSKVDAENNSQHISDWYTPSHIIHGFLFYLGIWLAPFVGKWALGARLVLAQAGEAAWELLENSPCVLERYRSQIVSSDYEGDSVLNSFFDIIWMSSGFLFAYAAPWWLTLIVAAVFELFVGFMIGDNLTLNIVNFIHPTECIKEWQLKKKEKMQASAAGRT